VPPDLGISPVECQEIFAVAQKSKPEPILTQSAASLLAGPTRFACGCAPVDKLLNGGLLRGHILEISGPPGSCKEKLAIRFVKSFLEAGEEVIFVGMCSSSFLPVLLTVEPHNRLPEHDDRDDTRQGTCRSIVLYPSFLNFTLIYVSAQPRQTIGG